MSDTPTIKLRENGPLVAANVTSMTDADGAAMETKPVMALCRCGASKSKPFCDGSHDKFRFDGSSSDTASRDKAYTYTADQVTVHYSKLLCSHAGECVRRSSAMFDPKRSPWIVPENGSVETLTDIVAACPSGALRMSQDDSDPAHLFADAAEIVVEKNGPLRINGVALKNPKAMQGATPEKYVLCRCGKSGNKPYCDGTHYEQSWSDGDG